MARRAACLGAAAAALVLGCGDTVQTPSGRSMSAQVDTTAAAAARPNAPPRIASLSIDPRHPHAGEIVRAVASVSDPDGDPTHLRFRWRAGGQPLAATGESTTLPDLAKDARIEVEAIASDGRLDSEPMTASASMANRAPQIAKVEFDRAAEIRAGDPVVALVDADDPDGDPVQLSYQWIVNDHVVEHDGDGATFDTKELHRGDRIALRVVASDGEDQSEGFDTPSLILGNAAPTITSTPPPGMAEDGSYRYAVEASDPDRDRSLRFRLGEAPEGATIDPVSGEFAWRPSARQTGTHAIEVIVADGHGGEAKQRFEVRVRDVDQPPAAPATE